MSCRSWREFVRRTGLIEDEDTVSSLGFENESGGIETYELRKLNKFVEQNPKYHIITMCDTDKGYVYDNNVRIVNRLKYFLGTGSKDYNLYFNDRSE